MNYTVRSSTGARLCPTSIPTGRVCGEDDDVFFNSLAASATNGVPLYGPNSRVGSATIQANGTGYDPVGLTNDYEFDYGIGSDDGATNNIVYSDGIVGLGMCTNANTIQSPSGAIKCGSGQYGWYTATPSAVDFGGETGETSTGEMAYWTPQGTPGLGPTFQTGAATPITHLVTGPSLLVGLWNMTGSTDPPVAQPYTGHAPYPAYEGGAPLSYANIAPANAWVGIAQDSQTLVAGAGAQITSQEYFQVAPTFGFFSYWKGSGGDLCAFSTAIGCTGIGGTTTLGPNLFLPTGWYTLEVLLSGYEPAVINIDLTDAQAPDIKLTPDYSTGAYTPDWAFSNSDLANLSVSPSNSVPTGAGTSGSPYLISAPAPDVGTVTSFSGGQVQIGQPGSLSWLFSNLNDYDFTVWIGGFINSTTATTQFNPAPSFPMVYPTWQYPGLSNGVWDLPTTDGFQYLPPEHPEPCGDRCVRPLCLGEQRGDDNLRGRRQQRSERFDRRRPLQHHQPRPRLHGRRDHGHRDHQRCGCPLPVRLSHPKRRLGQYVYAGAIGSALLAGRGTPGTVHCGRFTYPRRGVRPRLQQRVRGVQRYRERDRERRGHGYELLERHLRERLPATFPGDLPGQPEPR